jgi:hypothetical protein
MRLLKLSHYIKSHRGWVFIFCPSEATVRDTDLVCTCRYFMLLITSGITEGANPYFVVPHQLRIWKVSKSNLGTETK